MGITAQGVAEGDTYDTRACASRSYVGCLLCCEPYHKDAHNRLLWQDKTCPART